MPASPSHPDRRRFAARIGFTLTELMVATIILLLVVIATSKIFSTASQVTGLGEANADVLQEAAAIEQQIRADFARLDRDGFFAIQSNAVRNDFNGPGVLLDPNRPPTARFRADQLVFFIAGAESTRNYNTSGYASYTNAQSQQSSVARVYYGHAFQLPEAGALEDPDQDWAPWRAGQIDLVKRYTGTTSTYDVPLIPPRQWLLSRQVVLLADDGGAANAYYGANNSTAGIWDADIRNGRVDIAASTIDRIRKIVMRNGDNDFSDVDPWSNRAALIGNAIFFPRAERIPPLDTSDANNPDYVRREDHALTTHVLGTACSEFRVEWAYANGVGQLGEPGDPNYRRGVLVPITQSRIWFGLDEERSLSATPNYEDLWIDGRYPDVVRFLDWDNAGLGTGPVNRTIFPDTVERPVFASAGAPVLQYRAFFGYNEDEPRDVLDVDADGDITEITPQVGYTPWPDAVRITMTLHDPEARLENGRTFQFIVDLPRREP